MIAAENNVDSGPSFIVTMGQDYQSSGPPASGWGGVLLDLRHDREMAPTHRAFFKLVSIIRGSQPFRDPDFWSTNEDGAVFVERHEGDLTELLRITPNGKAWVSRFGPAGRIGEMEPL